MIMNNGVRFYQPLQTLLLHFHHHYHYHHRHCHLTTLQKSFYQTLWDVFSTYPVENELENEQIRFIPNFQGIYLV